MAENGAAEFDNGTETQKSEAVVNEVDSQATQQTIAADPTAAMQSALIGFDGLRVDAAIQVYVVRQY